MKKSNMTRDFDTKHALRDCNGGYMHKTSRYNMTGAPTGMADGGMVSAIRGLQGAREKAIDDAVNGPKKPAAAPAKPAAAPAPEDHDDSDIGIHIPKPPKPAAPPPKKGLLGIGFMGLRDGGFIDDGEEPAVMRGVPQNPATFAAGGKVQGPGGPTDDKVPAMLSHGEFVLPADTVKKVGAHNLEALRQATHTPVKMADGGEAFDENDMQRRDAMANPAQSAPSAPAQSAFTPGDPSTFDARDLRNAADHSPRLSMPSPMADATSRAMDFDPSITRTGNAYSGVGKADPGDNTIANANANARAQMDAMDAQKNAGYAAQRQGLYDASMQNQAAYDQRQHEAQLQSDLRNPNLTKSAKARLLTARGQDIQHETNVFGRAVQMRGQDIGADTSRRGQDISAASAAAERGVQTRGQDLTAYSNQTLRNLQAAQFGRQIQQQDREYGLQQQRFGLDQNNAQRAAQQQGYQNLQELAKTAHTVTDGDGKPQVDATGLASTTDKLNHTAMNLLQDHGIDVRTLPPQVQSEFVNMAKTATNTDEAAKGFLAKFGALLTGRSRGTSRDLRDYQPQSFEPGALPGFDNVRTNVGNIGAGQYITGNQDFFPSGSDLKDVEREATVGRLMQTRRGLRDSRE